VGLPLYYFWVSYITNAFNLITGWTCWPPGLRWLSSFGGGVVAIVGHNEVVLVLTLALAGASVIFAVQLHPASIFLGYCLQPADRILLSSDCHRRSTTLRDGAVAIPIVSHGTSDRLTFAGLRRPEL